MRRKIKAGCYGYCFRIEEQANLCNEPRLVQQNKVIRVTGDVVQKEMQCNAGKRGRREGRERGERGIGKEEKVMAWGDRPGRIDMGSYTLKSLHRRHPTRRDLPIHPIWHL